LIPLKNIWRRSVGTSYPVVAPVVTIVEPYFSNVSSLFQWEPPMCSKISSTPGETPSLFAIS